MLHCYLFVTVIIIFGTQVQIITIDNEYYNSEYYESWTRLINFNMLDATESEAFF